MGGLGFWVVVGFSICLFDLIALMCCGGLGLVVVWLFGFCVVLVVLRVYGFCWVGFYLWCDFVLFVEFVLFWIGCLRFGLEWIVDGLVCGLGFGVAVGVVVGGSHVFVCSQLLQLLVWFDVLRNCCFRFCGGCCCW